MKYLFELNIALLYVIFYQIFYTECVVCHDYMAAILHGFVY